MPFALRCATDGVTTTTTTWYSVSQIAPRALPASSAPESGKAVAPHAPRRRPSRSSRAGPTNDVVALGQLAEACATHLTKGRQVLEEVGAAALCSSSAYPAARTGEAAASAA